MAGFETIEENLRSTLAIFGLAARDGESRQLPGVAVTSAAIQFSMFNSAVLTAPVNTAAEFERRIRSAGSFFGARKFGWSFWVCQDWLEKNLRKTMADIFDRNHMHFVVELPGMAAENVAPPTRPLPRLDYRRVDDAVTRADFNRIMSIAFGIPMPIARTIYESERTWSGGLIGHVGYMDDLPVTSAATLTTDEVVGLYAVGTLPTHLRKGYAEAIVRHALEQARIETGIAKTILQSSEAGFALYRKMGYRPVTRYAVFATN